MCVFQVNPSPPLQHGNVGLSASSGDDVNGPATGGLGVETGITGNHCIRQGCTNPAITSSEWEDEYCSNECVIGHCRCVGPDATNLKKNSLLIYAFILWNVCTGDYYGLTLSKNEAMTWVGFGLILLPGSTRGHQQRFG